MARKCVGLQQQQQQMEYNINTLTRSLSTDYGRLQYRESLVLHGESSNEQQHKMVW